MEQVATVLKMADVTERIFKLKNVVFLSDITEYLGEKIGREHQDTEQKRTTD